MVSAKRKPEEQPLKSIWDQSQIDKIIPDSRHMIKIWRWLLGHPNKEIHECPFREFSIPKKLIQAITGGEFARFTTKIVDRIDNARGDTSKLLIELQDGHRIETVIIRHPGHTTVCVSSQVGCQMGCRFCATGTMGIIGDLNAGEILEQVIQANIITPVRNVVMMGMGEPLKNYENVKLAVQFMIDERRLGLSPRHVTVSTVGVLKSMYQLTADLPQLNLALSLHAPNQEVRLKIVPTASSCSIEELMAAVDNHIEQNILTHSLADQKATLKQNGFRPSRTTGIMIEYILIHNVNDRPEHAHELGRLLAPRREHLLLNLIPYNPTEVAEFYEPPTKEDVSQFFDICRAEPYQIHTRVRHEMGQDVAAACGQLALVKEGADIEDVMGPKTGPVVASRKHKIVALRNKHTAASTSKNVSTVTNEADSNPQSSVRRWVAMLALPALAAILVNIRK